MMKKMVYVVNSGVRGADEFDIFHSYDVEQARRKGVEEWEHLTAAEQKRSFVEISGWEIEVENDQPARDAFRDWSFEQAFMPDPEYYEVIA